MFQIKKAMGFLLHPPEAGRPLSAEILKNFQAKPVRKVTVRFRTSPRNTHKWLTIFHFGPKWLQMVSSKIPIQKISICPTYVIYVESSQDVVLKIIFQHILKKPLSNKTNECWYFITLIHKRRLRKFAAISSQLNKMNLNVKIFKKIK